MFKNLVAAVAIAFAAVTLTMGTANAITLNTNGPVAGGTIGISQGDVYTMEIGGDAADGAGSYSFGFLAATSFATIETNSLNPITGFVGAVVTWSTGINGTGSILGSISGAALAAGDELLLAMISGQTYWLTATWTDVSRNGSNFDLRVEAVPVPLPLLLLGTALIGMGTLARRRKVAN